jgi:hypothetical protein
MNTGFFRGLLWALFLAIFIKSTSPAFAANETNSWTKPTSGYWEEPYWSTGQLPSITNGPILFTNPGWKALAIGGNTTANYADHLRIKSLTIDAPVDSHNLLLLNWAGLLVALHPDALYVGTNGSLDSHFSAIDAGTATLNGTATFADFGQSRFGQLQLGQNAPAELDLSNGWFSAEHLIVARGGPSSFNQSGGSNQVSAADGTGRASIGGRGVYNLSGGDFKATFIDLSPTQPRFGRPLDLSTAARLNVTAGRAEVQRQLTIGGFTDYDYQPGVMDLSGGFFKGGDILVIQGQVTQTGGTNQVTQLSLSPAEYDAVNYVMNGGRLESARVSLGYASSALGFFSYGVFTQSGGVHSNSQSIMAVGTYIDPENQVFNGTYFLAGGTLFSPGIGLDGGRFDQSAGSNYAQRVSLTNGGSYVLSGGTLITSNTIVEDYARPAIRPRFTQTGGEHRVKRLLWLDSGGVYVLQGGVLSADMISIRAGTEFHLEGGTVSSNNLVEIDGGIMFLNGNYSLGWLEFNGTGTIDFQSGSSIVHFTKVGYPPPALDGGLVIKNWKGSAQSPGRDQFYIDSIDQYISSRLRSMTFVDPAGYPPGNYPARRKPSGEIVPLDRPLITATRTSNGLRMTWPDGYQLFTSDRVTGPYQLVQNAQSGYTALFTDPHRFFVLRPTQ